MKVTAQGTLVIDPYNSELIKFAILPKKIPIGETNATTSRYSKTLSLFFLANINTSYDYSQNTTMKRHSSLPNFNYIQNYLNKIKIIK